MAKALTADELDKLGMAMESLASLWQNEGVKIDYANVKLSTAKFARITFDRGEHKAVLA